MTPYIRFVQEANIRKKAASGEPRTSVSAQGTPPTEEVTSNKSQASAFVKETTPAEEVSPNEPQNHSAFARETMYGGNHEG